MPTDLAALLAEDGALPAEAVQRALARQREAGGALDTALLEFGAISEEALIPLLARAAGVPAAPESAWSGADARARRVFPSRVAERHGLAPFALDGRELSLVATCPVDVALLDEISFMLSLHLTAHVGPEWRVRDLIHRLYGTPLPARLAALAGRSGARTAPVAPALPPEPEVPPPAPPPTGFERDESEPLEPLAAALEQALASVEFPWPEEQPAAGRQEPVPREAALASAGTDRATPPRWTLDQARAALAAAENRDEVVLAALRYARDFFQYAALFAVTRDAIAGHDALGAEDERERVRTVAVWATEPGMFRTVVETRSPYLGPVTAEVPSNQTVLAGLGRSKPRTALVCPVVLRDRPVCVLYADNGEAPVSARRLGDLLLFLSTVGAAFERIIKGRKETPRGRAVPAAPPSAKGAGEPASEARPLRVTAEAPLLPLPAVPPAPAPEPAPAPAPEPAPEPGASETVPAPAEAQEPPQEPEPAAAAASEPGQAPSPELRPQPEPADAIAAALASIDVSVDVDDYGPPAAERAAAPAAAEEGPGREEVAAPPFDVTEASPASAWRRTPAAESLDDIERQFFGMADPWGNPAATPEASVAGPQAAPEEAREPPAGEGEGVESGNGDRAEPAGATGTAELQAQAQAAEPGEAQAAEPGEAQAAEPAEGPAPEQFDEGALERALRADDAAAPEAMEPLPAATEPRDQATAPGEQQEPLPVPVSPPTPAPAPANAETPVTLADRALDADPAVASAACEALGSRRRDPALRPAVEKLRRSLLSGISSRAIRAARALGSLRDVEAIPLLVQVLEASEPETTREAAEALASITLQRTLGADARKWLGWWKQNRGRGRAEWLFSGLTSDDRDTRVVAEAELREAGEAPVEYSPDMPAADRERAARAWAGSLARSGVVL